MEDTTLETLTESLSITMKDGIETYNHISRVEQGMLAALSHWRERRFTLFAIHGFIATLRLLKNTGKDKFHVHQCQAQIEI